MDKNELKELLRDNLDLIIKTERKLYNDGCCYDIEMTITFNGGLITRKNFKIDSIHPY